MIPVWFLLLPTFSISGGLPTSEIRILNCNFYEQQEILCISDYRLTEDMETIKNECCKKISEVDELIWSNVNDCEAYSNILYMSDIPKIECSPLLKVSLLLHEFSQTSLFPRNLRIPCLAPHPTSLAVYSVSIT